MIRFLACCEGVPFADCFTDDAAHSVSLQHQETCPVDAAGHTVQERPAPEVAATTGGLNPLWDEVVAWARRNPVGQLVLGWRYQAMGLPYPAEGDAPANMFIDQMQQRAKSCSRYAYTITSPDTVDFVAQALGAAAIDPLAGTGYWTRLLNLAGVDVATSDLDPPVVTHVPVHAADAVGAVRAARGSGRRLLLAWPPWADPVGANVLDAYDGDRVVYLGDLGSEDLGGVCGDARMAKRLRTEWRKVAQHHPPAWYGQDDVAAVFERKAGAR